MKVLIAYGTNSGGTYYAGTYIKELLEEKKYKVDFIKVKDIVLGKLQSYDLVIFGTNSWFYNGQEGQPHIWYNPIRESFSKQKYKGQKFAIYALGDSSYAQFCHSADHLEEMVDNTEGNKVVDSLRIDGYYRDETKSRERIKDWISELTSSM